MLKRRGLFQGVAEPDVSIDSRCWWKLRESENEAARGVSKPPRGPARGVWTWVRGPGVVGNAGEKICGYCFPGSVCGIC